MERFRAWIPLLKVLLAIAVVVGVGLLFARILQSEELQQTDRTRSPSQILWSHIRSANATYLVVASVLYLVGLAFSAAFWRLLLLRMNEPMPLMTLVRTYYISHLGKYAPLGKGWAMVLRVSLSHQGGVGIGTAALTGTYETLTTMAGGALLAAILVVWQLGSDQGLMWKALGLLALAGIPILPGVFNRIVGRLASRFLKEGQTWPKLSNATLIVGLVLSAGGWSLLGGSLAVTIKAVRPDTAINFQLWVQCTAFVAISYVAGFIASTPSGLGVRELILQQLLAPSLGPIAVIIVVLLRLIWVVSEVLTAVLLYFVPTRPRPPSPSSVAESIMETS